MIERRSTRIDRGGVTPTGTRPVYKYNKGITACSKLFFLAWKTEGHDTIGSGKQAERWGSRASRHVEWGVIKCSNPGYCRVSKGEPDFAEAVAAFRMFARACQGGARTG